MMTLWALLATAFVLLVFHTFPDAYYDHKRDVRRAKEADEYRRIQLALPGLVKAFSDFTVELNETSYRFHVSAASMGHLAETYRSMGRGPGG
jgi:hypothetical protein